MSERLLCTVKGNVSLTNVDPAAGAVTGAVTVGTPETGKPHEIVLSADGARAFVSIYGSADYGRNQPDNRIAVVDLKTDRLITHIDLDLYRGPHALARDAAGKIWVTVEESCSVLRIDPQSLMVERCVWMQVPVHFVATSPDGMRLFFTHKQYPFVTELDPARGEVVGRIGLEVGAQALHVSRDGHTLYVGDLYRPLLHVIDLARRQLVRTVPLAGVPGWPYMTPDAQSLLMMTVLEAEGRGFIEILDPRTLAPRHVVEVAAEPFHALAAEDGIHVYVALGTGHLAVIDIKAGRLTRTIALGANMPEAVVRRPDLA